MQKLKARLYAFLLGFLVLLLLPGVALAGTKVFVCGEPVEFSDAQPFSENGRLYIPLRAVSQTLGMQVGWDGAAVIEAGNRTVRMPIGRKEAVIIEKGRKVTISLDARARVVNKRTFVPLRFVSEALGCRVAWDAKAGIINIVPDLASLPRDVVTLDPKEPSPYFAAREAGFVLAKPQGRKVAARMRVPLEGRIRPGSYQKLVWVASKGEDEMWVRFTPGFDGSFAVDAWLPFGPGEYTVSIMGLTDEKTSKDGYYEWTGLVLTNLKAVNFGPDVRFLVPTDEVDWTHPEILKLAGALTAGKTDREKALAVHDWAARNITYDVESLKSGIPYLRASEVLEKRKGICRHYSVLTAALLRASGIPAKVVDGSIRTRYMGWVPQEHVWNEAFIGGRWVTMDVTMDAGYLSGERFVPRFSREWFDPSPERFRETHQKKDDGH